MAQTIAGRVAMLPVRYSDIDPHYTYQEGHERRLQAASRALSNDLAMYVERLAGESRLAIDVGTGGAVYSDVEVACDVADWLRSDQVRESIGRWEPAAETYSLALDLVAGVI